MEQTAYGNTGHSPAPAPKRRKLRKGTSSCWECKRRKARCTFTAGGAINDTCSGCKHRGTRCIPQDLPDQPAPGGSNRHLVGRLAEVEALVGRLVQTADHSDQHDGVPSSARPQCAASPHMGQDAMTSYTSDYPLVVSSGCSETGNFSSITTEGQSNVQTTWSINAQLAPSNDVTSPQKSTIPNKYESVCKELLAVWPAARDMDIILSAPVHTSTMVRGVTLTQPVNPSDISLPSPEAMLELPPPESHPTLIARKLLLLATFLQGIPPESWGHLETLTTSRQELMSRSVSKAHHLVTCNDELVASIEGIECLMLQGLYESYSGSLRPSWLAVRRAVTIAQMLGLHRGIRPTSLTDATFTPDHVWFRLVQLDRYLSIMLGLPPMSLDDSFAKPGVLNSCTPEERMQRLNCAAAGRLLRRTPEDVLDVARTKEIDKLLQDSSASLPPQWWLTPTLSATHAQMDTIRDTLRFNGHFMHYHMLVHLHLPYLLASESSREYEYSRVAAISASREILSRIASFRTFRPTGYYCRGVDLLAFLAGTALALAHICDHGRRRTDDGGFLFLAHHRLSDRGLLEHTLKYMSEMARVNGDVIGSAVSTLLEYLLAIEEDAAGGSSYNVITCTDTELEEEEEAGGSSVKLSADASVLTIHLPHIWVVKIERGPGQSKKLPIKTSHSSNTVSLFDSPDSPYPTMRHRANPSRTSSNVTDKPEMYASPVWQNPSLAQLMPFATHDVLARASGGTDIENLDFFVPIQDMNGDESIIEDIDISFFNSLIQEMPV